VNRRETTSSFVQCSKRRSMMKQSNSLEKQSDNRLPTKQTQQEATLQLIVNLLNNMDQRLNRLEFKWIRTPQS